MADMNSLYLYLTCTDSKLETLEIILWKKDHLVTKIVASATALGEVCQSVANLRLYSGAYSFNK